MEETAYTDKREQKATNKRKDEGKKLEEMWKERTEVQKQKKKKIGSTETWSREICNYKRRRIVWNYERTNNYWNNKGKKKLQKEKAKKKHKTHK